MQTGLNEFNVTAGNGSIVMVFVEDEEPNPQESFFPTTLSVPEVALLAKLMVILLLPLPTIVPPIPE